MKPVWIRILVFASVALGSVASISGQSVVINEIMYHPESEDSNDEFIELLNTSATELQLRGWRFSRGIRFSFPDVTISSNGFLVIAADRSTFQTRHPSVLNVVGDWDGFLSNSGEKLVLEDERGREVDKVTYADDGDWGVRVKGQLDFGHRGWEWAAAREFFRRAGSCRAKPVRESRNSYSWNRWLGAVD